jgi:hypothetical protein
VAADRFVLSLAAALVLTLALNQTHPDLDGSLQAMAASEGLALAPGEELLRAGRDGDVWVEAIRSPVPITPPDDETFRAELRDRCAQARLSPLLKGGGTVIEHRHGSDGALVYTLRMDAQVCGQVRMG